MSASIRFDTAPWLPGAVLFGEAGFGVLAQDIPQTGENGAASGRQRKQGRYPDNNKEICGRLTVFPSAGLLQANENTSFVFSAAPIGTYSATYQLYVDGVLTGPETTVQLVMTEDGVIVGWIG